MPERLTASDQEFYNAHNEQSKRKERISDDRFGAILSAIGNSELKAGLIAAMQASTLYSSDSLHRLIVRAQGENAGWVMNKNVPFQFCRTTFTPIGLVTKEVVQYSEADTIRYRLSNDGNTLGKPLAGLLLDFSQKRTESLYDYFGSTNDPKGQAEVEHQEHTHDESTLLSQRSPQKRYAIFYELTTAERPLRITDIIEPEKMR